MDTAPGEPTTDDRSRRRSSHAAVVSCAVAGWGVGAPVCCDRDNSGERAMTLVAISASYGARGTEIAPAIADRLGIPFVDRAIPLAVADRLDISYDDAAARDE